MLVAWSIKACIIGAVYAAGVTTGIIVGRGLWKTGRIAEPYARQERQADGSLILTRAETTTTATPKHEIPTGAVVERIVQLTGQPRPWHPEDLRIAAGPAVATPKSFGQPSPIRVDMTLVRLPNQSRRVIASSPDGLVIGGLDVPVETLALPSTCNWTAGVLFGKGDGSRTIGGFVERDWSRLRVGLDVLRQITVHQGTSWSVVARAGVRF